MSENDLMQRLEVGTILTFEHGAYSDKGWTGPYRVIKAFIKQEVIDAYRAWWLLDGGELEDFEGSYDAQSKFPPFLVTAGFIEAVDNATDWYIGGYGFDP